MNPHRFDLEAIRKRDDEYAPGHNLIPGSLPDDRRVLIAEVERLQKLLPEVWEQGWRSGADDQKSWNSTRPGAWTGPTPNPYRDDPVQAG